MLLSKGIASPESMVPFPQVVTPPNSMSRPSLKRKAPADWPSKPHMPPMPFLPMASLGNLPPVAPSQRPEATPQFYPPAQTQLPTPAPTATTASLQTKTPFQGDTSKSSSANPSSQTFPMVQPQGPGFPTSPFHPQDPSTSMPLFAPDDPRYTALVTRLATYYQQRCQAIVNFQHQKFQTWATAHRQKCQETMQAAMLVIAWYVRDRISRRRRREKRKFKRGLVAIAKQPRGSRAEAVADWVLNVPEELHSHEFTTDGQGFDPDAAGAAVEPSKDDHLLNVADSMLRNQFCKADVPFLGVLDFAESETSSIVGEDEVSKELIVEDEDDDEELSEDSVESQDGTSDHSEESEEFWTLPK